jgi:dTDP-4-dehydrorhamnose 3,5-epimerase-like enzyme
MTENNNGQQRPELLRFPRITDNRGSLTFVQHPLNIPFSLRRVFYLYGMPEGSQRGGHAHIQEEQILIAIAGKFNVKVFDGKIWETFTLDSPEVGLYLPPPFWRELCDFSPEAVCLTLSSTDFNPEDYLSPIEEFTDYLQSNLQN